MINKKIVIATFFLIFACLLLSGCHWFGSPLTRGKETKSSGAEDLYKEGISFAASKDYEKAIEAFNKALKVDSGYDNAYWGRGVARAVQGKIDRAISDYDKALELNVCHPWAYYNRGCAWRDKGNYDKAIEDFTRHLEIRPRDAEAYSTRAHAGAGKGDLLRALADAEKACSLEPDNEIYQFSAKKIKTMINKDRHTKE